MLVYTLLSILLLTSKGLPQNLGHNVDYESAEKALLERVRSLQNMEDDDDDDENQDDELVLKALFLKALQHKRNVPRLLGSELDSIGDDKDTYRIYVAKNYKMSRMKDQKNKLSSNLFRPAFIKTNVKKMLNKKQDSKYKMEQIYNIEAEDKEKEISEKDLENNDATATIQMHDTEEDNQKKTTKNNNVQVATVTLDDSVSKQEEFVRKLNPKDVFYEPELDNNLNATTTAETPKKGPVKQLEIATNKESNNKLDRVSFIAVIAGCIVAVIAGVALATYCWFKLRRETQNLNEKTSRSTLSEKKSLKKKDVNNGTNEDDKLSQSAEVFHYLHAKKQMQQMGEQKKPVDNFVGDETTDEEDGDDENTVYECPGLAPPGDMKVSNPLFSDAESYHSDHHSDGLSNDDVDITNNAHLPPNSS